MRRPVRIQRRAGQYRRSIRTEELGEIRAKGGLGGGRNDSIRCGVRSGSLRRATGTIFGPAVLKDRHQVSTDSLESKHGQPGANEQDLPGEDTQPKRPTRARKHQPPEIQEREGDEPTAQGPQVSVLKLKPIQGLRDKNKTDRQGQDHQRRPPTNRSDGFELSRHTRDGPWTPGFVTRESHQRKRGIGMHSGGTLTRCRYRTLIQTLFKRSLGDGLGLGGLVLGLAHLLGLLREDIDTVLVPDEDIREFVMVVIDSLDLGARA